MKRIERESLGFIKPGQDLVVAGYAGLAGTALIVQEKKEELYQWFSRDYVNQMLELSFLKQEMKLLVNEQGDLDFWKNMENTECEFSRLAANPDFWPPLGVTECESSGEGGILKTLWDLSGAYMTGIRFSLHRIPVKQETIEICERYGLNPYRLFSSGCLLFAAGNGADLVEALDGRGIFASVVGKVTTGIKRVVEYGEVSGFLERPVTDEIYKVLPGKMGVLQAESRVAD